MTQKQPTIDKIYGQYERQGLAGTTEVRGNPISKGGKPYNVVVVAELRRDPLYRTILGAHQIAEVYYSLQTRGILARVIATDTLTGLLDAVATGDVGMVAMKYRDRLGGMSDKNWWIYRAGEHAESLSIKGPIACLLEFNSLDERIGQMIRPAA